MSDELTIPAHQISIDDAGRVVIENKEFAAALRAQLEAQDATDKGKGNFTMNAVTNAGCINVLSKCS